MMEMLSEIVIDSFAGGGGASTGIEMALQAMGVDAGVDIAINHNGAALAMHLANHPDTLHLEADIWTVDPLATTKGRPVGLLWGSPDCTHFSRAKSGSPVKKEIRGLAWSISHWAEQVRPRVILMENVSEFIGWGPTITGPAGHLIPDEARAGETFREWVSSLRRLGYKVEWRVLRACDYGAPTTRERLYVIARSDSERIVWPRPTHGDIGSLAVRRGRRDGWRWAVDVVDWNRECPSVLMNAEEGAAYNAYNRTRISRPLVAASMARLAAGVGRFVFDADRRYYVRGAFHFLLREFGRSVGTSALEPLPTITAGGGGKIRHVEVLTRGVLSAEDDMIRGRRVTEFLRAHGVWDGGEFVTVSNRTIVDIGMRMLTPRELARAQGFPEDYILAAPFNGGMLSDTDQRHKIGNSVCPPVAAALVTANYKPQTRTIDRAAQGWLFEKEAA